jgi:hypothetical protein
MFVSTSARRLTSRRVVTFACLLATAVSFFTLGVIHARGNDAVAQRLELQGEVRKTRRSEAVVAGATVGRVVAQKDEPVDIPTPARAITGSRSSCRCARRCYARCRHSTKRSVARYRQSSTNAVILRNCGTASPFESSDLKTVRSFVIGEQILDPLGHVQQLQVCRPS